MTWSTIRSAPARSTLGCVTTRYRVGVMVGPGPVLVSARLVAMTFQSTRPVHDVWVRVGTAPSGDPNDHRGVLEAGFADRDVLPTEETLVVAGERMVEHPGLRIISEDCCHEAAIAGLAGAPHRSRRSAPATSQPSRIG